MIGQRRHEITTQISELQKNWDEFGKLDPLWSILTLPEKQGGKWDVSEFFNTGKEEISALLSHIKSLHLNITYGQALDFGCGVGRLTQALAEYFDRVTGVDIAPSMIAHAREFNRFNGRCTYILNECDNLSCLNDNTFDLIYSNYTLQHMHPSYAERYLAEFVRVLAPNGILVFQLPTAEAPPRAVKDIVKRVLPAPALSLILKLRGRGRQPIMETHVLPKDRVIHVLEMKGARVVHVRHNPHHDSRWISLIYYVSKG